MNEVLRRAVRVGPLVSRIAAALVGGYALAALASMATLALPIARTEAVLWGMLASFVVYACTVIWVFAVRSAWRAWSGLVLAAAPLLLAAWSAGAFGTRA
ncbi:MAG: iron uptake protein [Ramlibacter sp.]|nr:iron uptake protein [Ramlibacter sp.]